MKNLPFTPNSVHATYTGGQGFKHFITKANFDNQCDRVVLDFQEGFGYCKVEISEDEYNELKGDTFLKDVHWMTNNGFFNLKK